MFNFGSGTVWGRATQDAFGNPLAASTPRLFGTLQDVSIDFNFDQKELYGRSSFPEDVTRGKGKITCKASWAKLYGGMVNELFFGQVNSTGSLPAAISEGGAIPATGAYTVTVANSATFSQDLGVRYVATGASLKLVPTNPTQGQYTVSNGVYTFSQSDASAAVLIDYVYLNATSGNTTTVNNTLMGTTPTFQFNASFTKDGKQLNFVLYKCIASKLSFATKLDDYMIPSFDFMAFANPAGQVVSISASE